jgi:Uma2 family endonuclease
MATLALQQRLLTVDEYHTMAEAGILGEDDHVELIDGKIVVMSPIEGPHIACVNTLNALLNRRIVLRSEEEVIVSVQNPVRLGPHQEPEPDVALLRPAMKRGSVPRPEDVLLLIEVAGPSLSYDRDVKLPRYAAAGIPEVWIVALDEAHVEAYRQPKAQGYTERRVYERGETIEIEALPGLGAFSVDEVLGKYDDGQTS